MRGRFADHFAEIEQQTEAALRDAVGTVDNGSSTAGRHPFAGSRTAGRS
jgi:hypothetical protein